MTSPATTAAIDAASFEQLQQQYPEHWQRVGPRVVTATASGQQGLLRFVQQQQAAATLARTALQRSGRHADTAVTQLIEARLALLATATVLQAAAVELSTTSPGAGSVGPQRFGWWSGTVINRLLFVRGRGLQRVPVDIRLFRALWPLVPQRRLLMPMVQPHGIYCFYSRQFVDELKALIGTRSCVEIAAGDGTLTRFLRHNGVNVTAYDDHSWAHTIDFPDDVAQLDAVEVLQRHRPQVVLCSFPPADNRFEERIFKTASVEAYVVVTTKHRGTSGNARAWQEQTAFVGGPDAHLSSLIVPPELDPEVHVYRRTP
jgi:hypothetical protein